MGLGFNSSGSLNVVKPETADRSILRRVLSWAYDPGKIDINYAIKPGRLYDSDRSDLIWLPEHDVAFCKVASDELKLALVPAICTDQRQGDRLKMTRCQYDGTWINHRQSKGKKRVSVPIHRDLKRVLDHDPRRSALILTTHTGLPWKSDWFRNRWREASVAAGISDLPFHDLRGTAVTMLTKAGCSNAEIAAITGHSLTHVETILMKYMSLTRDLARSAMTKLENAGSDFSRLA